MGSRLSPFSVLKRVGIIDWGFLIIKKIYENFVGTLETVRNREVSVLGGSTVLYFALLSAVFKALFAVVCKPQQTRQGESSVHANVQAWSLFISEE